ncbi:hypothetical protein EVA_01625 [gut metagenome]|uniref:Uncharacterized protein n=1 Tax=gut metagenome TaxID=749906 RepID=J9DBF5_9ZZZZ
MHFGHRLLTSWKASVRKILENKRFGIFSFSVSSEVWLPSLRLVYGRLSR